MQFILNTSFDPHFCALLDTEGNIIAQNHWMIPREDGQHIWNFLQQNLPPEASLNFIGGVSGPGSFSSLRTAGAVLNALSFKFNIPVHQARADHVIQDFLKTENRAAEPFLLNSFSQRIFWPQTGELKVIDLNETPLPPNKSFITSWLPDAKKNDINQAEAIDPLGPQQTLLTTLKNTTPQAQFVPDYEYPPVQS